MITDCALADTQIGVAPGEGLFFYQCIVLYCPRLRCQRSHHGDGGSPTDVKQSTAVVPVFLSCQKKIVKARQTESLKSIWVFFGFFLTALQKKLELWFGDLFDHLFLFFCL